MRGHVLPIVLGAALAMASCGGDDVAVVDDPPIRSVGPGPSAAPTDGTTTSTTTIVTSTIDDGSTPATASPTTDDVPPPTTSEPTMTSSLPDIPLVEQAIADLASRIEADPETIEVVSVEEVDWPDASIGCPQPGMAYAQVIVNGTRIVLRVDDHEYEYHQGGARELFFCPPERVSM